MGQIQASAAAESADSDLYASYSTLDLQRRAAEFGLKVPRLKGQAHKREMLIAMLRAHDAGKRSATYRPLLQQDLQLQRDSEKGSETPSFCDESVVQEMLDAPWLKGMDIGGTLVKMVIALPAEAASRRFPATFGATGRTRNDLDLKLELGGKNYVLCFASGATCQIAAAVSSLHGMSTSPRSERAESREVVCKEQLCKEPASPGPRPCLSTLSTSDSFLEEALEDQPTRSLVSSSSFERDAQAEIRRNIFTSGGGAHKYASLFRDSLQIELVPVKELTAVVDGLLFLADGSKITRQGLLYEVKDGVDVALPWPQPSFPFLVVNIGSGVSILRVNSAEGDYERVGGTACGGATFLGLTRALTSANNFEEALALAEGGDASKCDLLVRDIYGEEGSSSLGLPGRLTAANCGRLCEDNQSSDEQDLARALLQMVTQQCVLLSSAYARQLDCIDRVFFAGGFLEEGNHLARQVIASNFRNLGGRAYFLRHCDFLGALGSLRSCISATS